MISAFDWQRMLLDGLPLSFLGEIAVRVLFGYTLVFLFLKFSGRRGIRQLSIFELVVILTLGATAGDVVIFYDVPMLSAAMVFLCILLLYRATTYLMQSSERFTQWVEGKPETLIHDGMYSVESFRKMNITDDEFLMELRQQSVEHLGQVRLGILEVDGNLSLFFYDPEHVRPGLSVLPPQHRDAYRTIPLEGNYACVSCGCVQSFEGGEQDPVCPRCRGTEWASALTTTRQA